MTDLICSLSMCFYLQRQQKSWGFSDMETEWCSQPRYIALWSRCGAWWWERTLEASSAVFFIGNTRIIQVWCIFVYTYAGQVSSCLWASRTPLFPGEEKGSLDILSSDFESPCLRPVSNTSAEKPLIPTALYYTRDMWHEVLAFDPNKLQTRMLCAGAVWN